MKKAHGAVIPAIFSSTKLNLQQKLDIIGSFDSDERDNLWRTNAVNLDLSSLKHEEMLRIGSAYDNPYLWESLVDQGFTPTYAELKSALKQTNYDKFITKLVLSGRIVELNELSKISSLAHWYFDDDKLIKLLQLDDRDLTELKRTPHLFNIPCIAVAVVKTRRINDQKTLINIGNRFLDNALVWDEILKTRVFTDPDFLIDRCSKIDSSIIWDTFFELVDVNSLNQTQINKLVGLKKKISNETLWENLIDSNHITDVEDLCKIFTFPFLNRSKFAKKMQSHLDLLSIDQLIAFGIEHYNVSIWHLIFRASGVKTISNLMKIARVCAEDHSIWSEVTEVVLSDYSHDPDYNIDTLLTLGRLANYEFTWTTILNLDLAKSIPTETLLEIIELNQSYVGQEFVECISKLLNPE
jgi:hypothetical protein